MTGLLTSVAKLVSGLAHDFTAVKTLRNDPGVLAVEHGLSETATAALHDVDRFFRTEKPILQTPRPAIQTVRATVVTAAPMVAVGILPPVAARAPLTASSDTGSLLPGPNTGTHTTSGSGTVSLTGVAPSPGHPGPAHPTPGTPHFGPAPAPPGVGPVVPQPPIPEPKPPFAPVAPATPMPIHPAIPLSPAPFWTPPSIDHGPPCEPSPRFDAGTGGAAPHDCGSCEAAVVAINALVAATAQASLTAIAAIAAQRSRRNGP